MGSQAATTTPAAAASPPDRRRWTALVLLCAAFFMVLLDSSIVLVALPPIGAELSFSSGDLQWVMSAYMLAFGGLLLLGGRASDLLGRRRLFVIGVVLFALASLAAGLAASSGALIAARVAQGVAAAIMVPTALSIVMTMFPEGPERNKALGVWTSTGAIAGTTGWLIGGPITDGLGWQWIFYINVPVALVVALLIPRLVHESRAETALRSFDAAGALTITAALVALVYAVGEAPKVGWGDLQTLALLALAVALAIVFVAIEARAKAPLAPLHVFRSRTLAGGNLVLLALGMAAFGIPFLLTQYAQQVLHWSPAHFGVAFVVMPFTVLLGSFLGQALATRGGIRLAAVTGLALAGASCLLLTRVTVGGDYLGELLPAFLVLGPGVGFAYVAGSIAGLTGVAESEAGLASGLSNASFQIGAAIGVAIVSTVAVSETRGSDSLAALTNGYTSAFAVSTAFAVVGIVVALLLLGRRAGRDAAAASAGPAPAEG